MALTFAASLYTTGNNLALANYSYMSRVDKSRCVVMITRL